MVGKHNLKAKIIVVDGDAQHRAHVQDVLASDGFKSVRQASQHSEAVRLAESFPPDLVLLEAKEQSIESIKHFQCAGSGDFLPVLMLVENQPSRQYDPYLSAGAFELLRKPAEPEELSLRVRNGLYIRNLHLQIAAFQEQIEKKVAERTRALHEAQIEILQRLGRASEYRDDDTGDHTKRVGTLSARIAQAMNLSGEEVELIRLAAPLHDIGKIGIRDAVLMKPGKLTESEYTVMRTHAMIGSRILEGKSPLLKMAEIIARTHHERWDGTGYPSRLSGDAIPLPGRIVAVADVFDALISARSYKAAWPVTRAIAEIKAQSGRHFDPKVVSAFLHVMVQDSNIQEAA